jgi:hypothetical protein
LILKHWHLHFFVRLSSLSFSLFFSFCSSSWVDFDFVLLMFCCWF